eukprot:scaffold103001_cov58-Attheya_sp.AAC.6
MDGTPHNVCRVVGGGSRNISPRELGASEFQGVSCSLKSSLVLRTKLSNLACTLPRAADGMLHGGNSPCTLHESNNLHRLVYRTPNTVVPRAFSQHHQ